MLKSVHGSWLRVFGAACVVMASSPVAASTLGPVGPTFYVNYDATSQYLVSDIAIIQMDSSSSSVTNSFTANVGETVIQNPFPVTNIPTGDFLLGVATNLASDNGSGQQHLVLFTNDTFAVNAQDIAFGTLFPNTNEATLINSLEVIAQAIPGDTDVAYNNLFSFESGDAQSGTNGSIAFATGDSFSEIAFSGGQIIGTGTSFPTVASPGSVSAAPEPSSWLLMIAGLGWVGAMLRRAKRPTGCAVVVAFSG